MGTFDWMDKRLDEEIERMNGIIMGKLSCSVVLSTYNGKKFLEKQLDSIRNQSRNPDEVIIGDDGSKDNTVLIITSYIKKYGLNWRLICNDKNKGFYKNFIDLAYQTKSDVVFFCDQDDIWERDKIKENMSFFESHPRAMAVSCNIKCINQDDLPVKNRQYFNVDRVTKIKLKNILYTSNILGCTLGFRRKLLNIIKQDRLKATAGSHDTLISIVAASIDGLYKIPYVGISYRIHGHNNSMQKENSRAKQIEKLRLFYSDLNDAIVNDGIIKDVIYKRLLDVETLQIDRLNFLKKGTICGQLCDLVLYIEFAGGMFRGLRLCAADIYYSFKAMKR